jgi:hypothetical protein
MMACYRNVSMLVHAAVAVTDAARATAAGQIGTAVASLFGRSVAHSLWALIEETPKLRRLARRRKRVAASSALLSRDRGADCRADASWATDVPLGPVAKTGSAGNLSPSSSPRVVTGRIVV